MRIVWLDRAERDLHQVAEYIMQENPAAALKVVAVIREATQVLSVRPELGRVGRVEETRELVISGLPYIVPYQVVGSEVRILAVMHAARKWPDTL